MSTWLWRYVGLPVLTVEVSSSCQLMMILLMLVLSDSSSSKSSSLFSVVFIIVELALPTCNPQATPVTSSNPLLHPHSNPQPASFPIHSQHVNICDRMVCKRKAILKRIYEK